MQLRDIVRSVREFVREKFHSKNEDLPYYLTILIAAILFIVGINAFIELTDELAEHELGGIDHFVTNFVQSFKGEGLTIFFRFVTDLGDRYVYAIVIVGLAIYFFIKDRSWKFILQTVSVLLLSTLTNMMLKRIINRTRPALEHLVTVDTLSYPSGHAMSAMAFYGFLIYLSLRYTKMILLRTLFVAFLVVLILMVGLSRIYLGVHYPSDVAAGFIGGLIWITFSVIVFNVIDLWRKRRV